METKAEILAQIAADPEGALADIETLRRELLADRLILKGKESLVCYFSGLAMEYWKKYHLTRKALIRSRILVKALKQAAQGAQERRHSDLSAD